MWLTLEEVQRVTGAFVWKRKSSRFRGLAIDSRECEKEQLFIALRGQRVDGHAFVYEALQRGALGTIVEKVEEGVEATVFVVPNTYEALFALGRHASSRLQGIKIGITGTVGKTTCKHFFARFLGTCFPVAMTPRSFNTAIGVSVSFANFSESTPFIIVEAGISARGEMESLASIIRPEVVVFTAFGEGHLEGLGSVAGVVEEKAKLAGEGTQRVYLNVDRDVPGMRDIPLRVPQATVVPFGRNTKALLRLESFAFDVQRLRSTFTVILDGNRFLFEAPILAPETVLAALPAMHFALEAGVPLERIREVLEDFRELPGRGGFFRFGNGVIIDDTYNANPLSVRKAVDLATRFVHGGYRACLVLGDMLELGELAQKAHRDVLLSVKHSPVHLALLFGPCFEEVLKEGFAKEMEEGRFVLVDTQEEAHRILRLFVASSPKWVVLFKGSRSMGLESMIPEEWREPYG